MQLYLASILDVARSLLRNNWSPVATASERALENVPGHESKLIRHSVVQLFNLIS